MYKLLIEDLSGIWHIADLGDEKPAMNYQVNNIAELKDRQVDYSQALKLPPTPNNCAIFGYSNEFDVVSVIPYRKLNCRLLSEDSTIAGEGSLLILDKFTKYFEVQIVSGNVDLFELLKNKQVSELDLGYYTLGSKNMFGAYSTTDYCIPAVNTLSNIKTAQINAAKQAYPFAWLKNAIEKICTSNGYTLQTNLLDANWDRKAVNVCSLNPSVGSFIPFSGIASNFYSSGAVTHWHYIDFDVSNTGSGALSKYINTGYDPVYPYRSLRYSSTFDCTLILNFSISTTGFATGATLRIAKVLSTGVTTELIYEGDVISTTQTYTVPLLAGEILSLSLKKLESTASLLGIMRTNVSFSVSDINVTVDVPTGGNLYIAPNLGFETQFDLFKAFVQYYGMTVMVDNATKTIYCYTMQKIYDNKSLARDWSGKLSEDLAETSFSLNGYAKSNMIKFENNTSDKTDATIVNTASFTIDDETLEAEKELFAMKFESGKNYKTVVEYGNIRINSIDITNIPIEEYNDTTLTYSFKGAKPHIVDIRNYSYLGNTLLFAFQGELQNHINIFYSKLINNMLVNAKLADTEFLLTEQDIEDYKAIKDEVPGVFIPIYLKSAGAYFYINKIKNFVSGRPTKCELVRL